MDIQSTFYSSVTFRGDSQDVLLTWAWLLLPARCRVRAHRSTSFPVPTTPQGLKHGDDSAAFARDRTSAPDLGTSATPPHLRTAGCSPSSQHLNIALNLVLLNTSLTSPAYVTRLVVVSRNSSSPVRTTRSTHAGARCQQRCSSQSIISLGSCPSTAPVPDLERPPTDSNTRATPHLNETHHAIH
jgi:hypothetical protein